MSPVRSMNTTSAPTTPTPRRRRLRFSLRTLMVLMLILGWGFGWLAPRLIQTRKRQVAEELFRDPLLGDCEDGRSTERRSICQDRETQEPPSPTRRWRRSRGWRISKNYGWTAVRSRIRDWRLFKR